MRPRTALVCGGESGGLSQLRPDQVVYLDSGLVAGLGKVNPAGQRGIGLYVHLNPRGWD